MEVIDYELFSVPPRWVFLRLETDDGIIGWGEPAVEGRSETLLKGVSELIEDYILGADPRRTTDLWYRMYRADHYNSGPVLMSAIAGIDQALWDIKGKAVDRAVHELLGGPVRNKVRIYRWLSGDTPDELVTEAHQAIDDGTTALGLMAHTRPARVRTNSIVSRVLDRLETVHDAVDDRADLAIDFRGRVSTGVARQLIGNLESFNLMFIEEPVHPEYNGNLSELSSTSNTPFATGQRMYSRWDFREVLLEGTVDIVQPAIAHAGGITEVTTIGQMAEAYDVTLMPKCSVGPISFAAAMQVHYAVPNAFLQELHGKFYADPDSQFHSYLHGENFMSFDDGFLTIESGPGLGIEVDEDYVREQARRKTTWKGPTWHYEDGSVANW